MNDIQKIVKGSIIMGRKPIDIEKVKTAALDVFMEKGYDGTSMRDIAQRAGCSVGLTYNYYATKDEMFTGALDIFFEYHRKNLEAFKEEARRSPFRALTDLLMYVEKESLSFRKRNVKVHWTVRYAIRERSLIVLEPYVKEVVGALLEWDAKFPLPLDYTAHLLTYGVCGMMLREEIVEIARHRDDVIKSIKLFTRIDDSREDLVVPDFATRNDMTSCLDLYIRSREYYPYFDMHDFSARAERNEIVLMKDGKANGTVAGMLVFSKERKEIDSFIVSREYYNKGVGVRLLVTALAQFSVGQEIAVKIFLKNESEKTKLAYYFAMGFREISYDKGIMRLSRKVPEKAIDVLPKRKEESDENMRLEKEKSERSQI